MKRGLLALLAPFFSVAGSAQEMPNIILFLIDDMGWSDLGCYASDKFHETPHIDRIARQGVRFTNGYAACSVSSPTRASIMTGLYPARIRITDWIPGHSSGNEEVICPKIHYELPTNRITLAQGLKKKGYRTLHIGKWHLGEREEYWPEHYGFDVNSGGHSLGAPGSYHFPYAKMDGVMDWTTLNLPDNLRDGDYLTDILTDQALKEIDRSVRDSDPFFLNMSYYQVHVPLEGKPEYVEKYRAKRENGNYPGTKNLEYAAMIQSLDESVGRIWNKLAELNIEKETFIVITSDNGGIAGNGFNGNYPLRDGKGTYYEGGIREPFIIHWPGGKVNGTTSEAVVISNDIYATILDVAGATLYGEPETDGISLIPLLRGEQAKPDREAVFWHFPHFHNGPPVSVIRQEDYKLIHFLIPDTFELYNLTSDIGESINLARKMPDKTNELKVLLNTWKKKVNADELIRRTPETEKLGRKGNGWDGVNDIRNPPVFKLSDDGYLSISTFSEGVIRYTTDGSAPSSRSPQYMAPIDQREGGEVRAKVWSQYQGETVISDTYIHRTPVKNVRLAAVSSENEFYPSGHMLDGKPNTYWESQGKSLPENALFDLGENKTIRCFTYQPARRERHGTIPFGRMPDNRQGAITGYKIEIGDDPADLKTVKTGTFHFRKYAFLEPQTVYFDTPVNGRYIRFTATDSIDGKPVVNIQKIEFIP